MEKAPIESMKCRTCSFEFPFRPSNFWNFGTLYLREYDISVISLEYGGMSSVEAVKEEPLSFLATASTSERVKRVAGSQIASDKCFVTVGLLLLVRATFRVGYPSLNTIGGGCKDPICLISNQSEDLLLSLL